MINKPDEKLKPILKEWFQYAKRHKIISSLYKADNILKNTEGYEKDGIIKYVKAIYDDGQDFGANPHLHLTHFNYRFKDVSFRESLKTNYWRR